MQVFRHIGSGMRNTHNDRRFPAGEGRAWVGWGHFNADVVTIREFVILGRGAEMNAYEITDYAPTQGLIEGLLQSGRVQSRVTLVKNDAGLRPRMRFDLEEGANLGAVTTKRVLSSVRKHSKAVTKRPISSVRAIQPSRPNRPIHQTPCLSGGFLFAILRTKRK